MEGKWDGKSWGSCAWTVNLLWVLIINIILGLANAFICFLSWQQNKDLFYISEFRMLSEVIEAISLDKRVIALPVKIFWVPSNWLKKSAIMERLKTPPIADRTRMWYFHSRI